FHATDPMLTEAWQQLDERQIPIVLHASAVYGVDGGAEFCGARAVGALLDRYPELRVIVAHLGGPDHRDFLRLAELGTHHMDVSMSLCEEPFLKGFPAELHPRLAALSDRLLFGSDFPTIPHDYVNQVRGLGLLGLDDRQLRAVLHDNAVALGI
ncbi:MAG: amidohydrolase family protein, partial [Nitriliruptorales bacterium]|nr:amidohydrolase family protein [Nitriliruptorales bacterium]